MKQFTLARILLLAGFFIGCLSLTQTLSHVGDPTFMLVAEFEDAKTHAWYHTFREGLGDIAAMAVILLLFFGRDSVRQPLTWQISVILMAGYYAPFWVGMPFLEGLSAPHMRAELGHILMASFSLCGLFLAKREFYRAKLA